MLGTDAVLSGAASVFASPTLNLCWRAACFRPHALPLGEFDRTQVRELALLVRACPSVEPEAECLVAALEAKIFHSLSEHCSLTVVFEVVGAGRCVGFPLVALALAFGAFVHYGGSRPRLQQRVDVAPHFSEFVHCFVERPVVGGEGDDL